MKNDVNCLDCQYYYITWDPHYPRGCRFFGFKGRMMPSRMVQNSSGESCRGFTWKERPDHGTGKNP
ncbi:MAG TPA: uracil-DNA glycosylase [Ruminiclostridium sp.]|nr:uracil-DNA glycosylase [Ruminiclostridium sp.]